jgi:retron-type reverse transcriptase
MEGLFESACIIPPTQHGFRKSRSVRTSLSETWDDFTRAFDSKSNVDVVYFDIKSAFDTVDIKLLLQKLTNYVLGSSSTSWLINFLSGRSYSVKIGEFTSTRRSGLDKGVPQSCVLSPLLFNIFVSADLPNSLHDTATVKQYADDIKAYVVFPNGRSNLPSKLQDFINLLSSWCRSNGLLIASNKLAKNSPFRAHQPSLYLFY